MDTFGKTARVIVSILMESSLYFDIPVRERLIIVKGLISQLPADVPAPV